MGYFLRNGMAERVAVCDVWESRRRRYKCAAYSDFRELLARADVDAVVISTPEHWHVHQAIAAAKAGKDLYCEKPLGITLAEGRALAEAVRRYGRVFQHGTQMRSIGNFRLACELARNGRIGRLHTIKVGTPPSSASGHPRPRPVPKELDYELWTGPAPKLPYVGQASHLGAWNHRSDYSPGYISAWAVHYIDIAQWGNGTDRTGPVEIAGRGVFPPDGFNDVVLTWHVECTYANGVKMIYTSDNESRHGILFEGTAGWAYVNYQGGFDAHPKSLLRSTIGPNEVRLYRSPGPARNFLDCIRTRRPTVAPAEVAHRSTSVCLLSNIAVLTGRRLRWDPRRERFLNDDEANRMLARAFRPPWSL